MREEVALDHSNVDTKGMVVYKTSLEFDLVPNYTMTIP